MPRKSQIRARTTENITLTLDRESDARVRKAAAACGLAASTYVSALIRGEAVIAKPAAGLQDLALIANRVARALELLAQEPADVRKATGVLEDGAARIAELLRAQLPAYDAAVQEQVRDDTWGSPGR
ncbi:MAG: hypothetical protein WAN59_03550 [Candidatus Baltobacteraceae bacterium]